MYDFYDDEFTIEKERTKGKYKVVVSVLIAILIIIALCGYRLNKISQLGQNVIASSDELIQKSSSPNKKYTVKAYLHNGGATVDWGVYCDLIIDGNEKETKRIYKDYHIKECNIMWIDENTVSINNHNINLPDGIYDWTNDQSTQ